MDRDFSQLMPEDEKKESTQVTATEKVKKTSKKGQDEARDSGDEPDKKKKKLPRSESKKRGPARPLRRVPKEVLDSRIDKLEKRLKRTTAQMEDASRHFAAYTRERDFRKAEEDKNATTE